MKTGAPSFRVKTCICLTCLALLLSAAPGTAYIDQNVEALTLPRLLLEFRSVGIFEIARLDLEEGKVQYKLVETVQGCEQLQSW